MHIHFSAYRGAFCSLCKVWCVNLLSPNRLTRAWRRAPQGTCNARWFDFNCWILSLQAMSTSFLLRSSHSASSFAIPMPMAFAHPRDIGCLIHAQIPLSLQAVNFQGHVNVVGAAVRRMVAQRTGGVLLFNVTFGQLSIWRWDSRMLRPSSLYQLLLSSYSLQLCR